MLGRILALMLREVLRSMLRRDPAIHVENNFRALCLGEKRARKLSPARNKHKGGARALARATYLVLFYISLLWFVCLSVRNSLTIALLAGKWAKSITIALSNWEGVSGVLFAFHFVPR